MVGLHIWSAVLISLENKAARPVSYAVYQPVGSSYASRTMLVGGGVVFVFIVYHLLHYTAEVQYLNLTGQDFAAFMEKLPGQVPAERHDIFKMMVVGFSKPLVSGFYILGLALLCLHLSHGPAACSIPGLEERCLSAIPRSGGATGRGADLPRLYLYPALDTLRLWKGGTQVNLDAKNTLGPLPKSGTSTSSTSSWSTLPTSASLTSSW